MAESRKSTRKTDSTRRIERKDQISAVDLKTESLPIKVRIHERDYTFFEANITEIEWEKGIFHIETPRRSDQILHLADYNLIPYEDPEVWHRTNWIERLA